MTKLLVANESGSKILIEPLRKLGLPVSPCTHAVLPFGDIAFMGRGEGGAPLFIGIEYKRITDLAQSLAKKRFQGHQLLGMVGGEAPFDRRYLLTEGDFASDRQGNAVIFRGEDRRPRPLGKQAVALEQELLNITTRGGVIHVERQSQAKCLRWVLACYRYWTDKDLDDHKSHLAIYAPDFDTGLLTPPSDFRKALQVLLPGIGWATSQRVEEECWNAEKQEGSFRTLMLKNEKWWADLTTFDKSGKSKRVGEKRAKAIMEKLR
jgi:hypothetical protein